MIPFSPAQLQHELIKLMVEQVDSLKRQTFGGESEDELAKYECRQDRIRVLFDELHLDPSRKASTSN
jgi:hypothetical protein